MHKVRQSAGASPLLINEAIHVLPAPLRLSGRAPFCPQLTAGGRFQRLPSVWQTKISQPSWFAVERTLTWLLAQINCFHLYFTSNIETNLKLKLILQNKSYIQLFGVKSEFFMQPVNGKTGCKCGLEIDIEDLVGLSYNITYRIYQFCKRKL